jgi:tRNA(Ile)-lysidine synthase
MTLTDRFRQYIKKEDLFNAGDQLLLAVSGGVDSVVLCELCYQCGFSFAIAHCNFGLRGEESERDERFVQAVSEKYKVKFFVKRFDTGRYAEDHKVSIQVAARELRYAWFNQLANAVALADNDVNKETTGLEINREAPYRFIVTAHHADDNIETLLMNFFKGTGIAGLRGILPKQDNLIRPLLFCRKEELHAFAQTHQLSYVEDSSNVSDKYTRNYFRNHLFPDVEKVFPSVKDNLVDNLQRFRQIEILYYQAIEQHKKSLQELRGEEVHVPVLKLKKTTPLEAVVYEIIKSYGFKAQQVGEVIQLLDSESGKYIASHTYRIIRNRSWLIIAPLTSVDSKLFVIEEQTAIQEFQQGRLEFKLINAEDYTLKADHHIAALDASQLAYPLLLRKWKQGDYFYPLGMKKKKKLSRFFIDQKLSITEKERTWVLEVNKKIIWVIGRRIDDRFKVLPSTKKIMRISFLPKD